MSGEIKYNEREKIYLGYFNTLVLNVTWAEIHESQWKQVREETKGLNISRIFFNSTEKAHYEAMLWHLFRLIDTHSDSVSIWKFFNFAESNITIFSTDEFARRQKNHPSLERYIGDHMPVRLEDIREDRKKIDDLEETLVKLQDWRDKNYAHSDRGRFLPSTNSPKLETFTYAELEELIETLHEIIRRYQRAFDMIAYIVFEEGKREVQTIVQLIEEGMETRQAKLNAELLKLEEENRQ
jgi:hypothetical protein